MKNNFNYGNKDNQKILIKNHGKPLHSEFSANHLDQQRSELGSSQGRAYFGLVAVIQVMLVRQVQPCKRRPLRLWEFNPEGPRVIQNFLGLTHEEMYKSFFGPQVECPEITEDVGLSSNRAAEQVRNLPAEHTISHLLRSYF